MKGLNYVHEAEKTLNGKTSTISFIALAGCINTDKKLSRSPKLLHAMLKLYFKYQETNASEIETLLIALLNNSSLSINANDEDKKENALAYYCANAKTLSIPLIHAFYRVGFDPRELYQEKLLTVRMREVSGLTEAQKQINADIKSNIIKVGELRRFTIEKIKQDQEVAALLTDILKKSLYASDLRSIAKECPSAGALLVDYIKNLPQESRDKQRKAVEQAFIPGSLLHTFLNCFGSKKLFKDLEAVQKDLAKESAEPRSPINWVDNNDRKGVENPAPSSSNRYAFPLNRAPTPAAPSAESVDSDDPLPETYVNVQELRNRNKH